MATSIDFQNLQTCLPLVARQRKPILIRGAHGIGKSEVVYQFAKEARAHLGLKENTKTIQKNYGLEPNELPVVERRASQMPDAGDLMGLPVMDGEVTHFNPMEWFAQACDEPVVLFFDEVDRANQDVRQALFELTDSRKIAGQRLHDDTIVIACVNGGEGESNYVVGEMDPAELDRWTVFDVEPSPEDWFAWADGKIDPIILDFIKQNRAYLEHKREFEPNKKYPSRRSWKRLNDTLVSANLLAEPHKEVDGKKVINPALYYITQGFVGMEAAIAFQDFVKNYKFNLTIEDILEGRNLDKIDNLDVNQQIALIQKLGESPLMKEKLDDKQTQNIARFAFAVEHELVMELWSAVSGNNIENGKALHRAKSNGQSFALYLAEIVSGKPAE